MSGFNVYIQGLKDVLPIQGINRISKTVEQYQRLESPNRALKLY
ncbi:hypothetical protein EV198_1659 [Roseivirga ehrenbergii]|nr:hypothetical protein EV198_1659 [Roseivirga ehrenbergii]